jgi:hypothetical protein
VAQWVSANLAKLLPPGTQEILDTIETLIDVVKVPLDLVASILDTAKSLLVVFDLLDFLALLRGLIEDFKNSLLVSGLFVCDMWDYPVRQLTGSIGTPATGPDATFENINLDGHEFASSFLSDLDRSFDDVNDPERPQFKGSVGMLVILRAGVTPEAMGLTTEEGNIGDTFGGLSESIGAAARGVREVRYRAMLGKFKQVARRQPLEKVSVRVERVDEVVKLLGQISPEDLDTVGIPEDESTGAVYFDDKTIEQMSWESDVAPVLESIEQRFENSVYPDWNTIGLRDLHPDLVAMVDELFDPILDLLQSGSTIKQAIIDFINGIKIKLEALQNLIDSIEQILEAIERLINATGFHALYVSSGQGVNALRTNLRNATDFPVEGKAFYAGMAILAGSDAFAAFELLFSAVGS